jgi:hypothetical protein
MFRSSVFRRVLEGDLGFIASVSESSGLRAVLPKTETVAEVFESAYEVLLSLYRCEYVFKNEIARHLYFQIHGGPSSAKIFFEHKIGGRIADAVILNGHSAAYEIKTDLDSLDRLRSQVECFSSAFDRVNVVTTPGLLDGVREEVPKGIGIILFLEDGSLETVCESDSHLEKFDHDAAFKTLRTSEYEGIIREEFGELPDVEPWACFEACMGLFSSLTAEKAHALYVAALRCRVEQGWCEDAEVPPSLTATVLNSRLSNDEWAGMPLALSTSLP